MVSRRKFIGTLIGSSGLHSLDLARHALAKTLSPEITAPSSLSLTQRRPTAINPIDRAALIHRHSPTLRRLDPLAPLSLGNGEFAYWHYGLKTAQRWRELLGLSRNPVWDQVLAKLSPLPTRDGVYLAHENCPQTFTERNHDHPSMLGAFGVLQGGDHAPDTAQSDEGMALGPDLGLGLCCDGPDSGALGRA